LDYGIEGKELKDAKAESRDARSSSDSKIFLLNMYTITLMLI